MMQEQKVIAIIPARGGSKGVVRKNVRLLAGKPLVAHTIENARLAKSVNRIVVSTDDPEIAVVSKRYGAEVVTRPLDLSGDTASSEAALLHTLEVLASTEGYTPDIIVFLQCTSPLTLPEDVDGAIKTFMEKKADSVLTVSPADCFLWRETSDGYAEGINHDKSLRQLRQAREPEYSETGAVYVLDAAGFKKAKHRFFGKTVLHVVPHERSLQIDEPLQVGMAEALLRQRANENALELLPKPIGALILDFDGVFTDNKVVVMQDGQEGVICDRGDGYGLSVLSDAGIPIVVLSSEQNSVVKARCDKIGISCVNGLTDKLATLQQWLKTRDINSSHVVYVGNDVNDLECLQAVGCGVAVNDAHPQVLEAARIVLSSCGGNGAIREVVELLLQRTRGDEQ